jgi:hypothetical protein
MVGVGMASFEIALFLNLPEVLKVTGVDISLEGVAKKPL